MTNSQFDEDYSAQLSEKSKQKGKDFEFTTHDLIPLDKIKLRRDKEITKGKMRNKFINLKSNYNPLKIWINDIECHYKITRGLNIIKVKVNDYLADLSSGIYQAIMKVDFGEEIVSKHFTIDYRSRSHYRIKNNDVANTDIE